MIKRRPLVIHVLRILTLIPIIVCVGDYGVVGAERVAWLLGADRFLSERCVALLT